MTDLTIVDVAAGGPKGAPTAGRTPRRLKRLLRRFARRRIVILGTTLALVQISIAAMAPLLARYGPTTQNYDAVLQAPGWPHPMGTDDLGRDILSRLIYGARVSLVVSIGAVLSALGIGGALGLIVGYIGGRLDDVDMRIVDSLIAIPPLGLALLIAGVLASGLEGAMFAIAAVAIPTYTRLMRGQVLSVRQTGYVTAVVANGAGLPRILVRHVLPNAVNPLIVQASLGIGAAIITESSLSFIGLGAQPPTPTWGSMVQIGFQYLESAPWLVLSPAIMIFLAVLGFNLLGDGLRDALDPSLG